VLSGLPRDLDPAEAAMLHRAMPPALAASSGEQQAAGKQAGRNLVQTIAYLWISCMYTLLLWVGPKVRFFGAILFQMEQEHHYFARLLAMLVQFWQAVGEWLGRAGGSTSSGVILWAVGYTSQGVFGAFHEFAVEQGWEWQRVSIEQVKRGTT
jgi:hypothetical protein